ncbi:putative 3,4-dihydroxy-2-butanone kinase [Dichanthelium oligosanthes]|uniref:Putative 3,4-dihydroxy-2-butanone kinase n=1 Tax=Dichanthelium oligosanthes TaxID=888268 RepID=A0A1E5VAA0_9POAL|nr:putative 3,4-dihydroxy-2-butanone kinase [Dichanthelium oligosanthes]
MALQGKKLINNPDDVVTEFIEGLVETYPGLQYLDGFPQTKVVLRADVERGTYDKVAVISGGGSGHEPAHAGFVGPGMLTAAVSGDVFASPPVDSILAAIRAVTGPMGCLLIVKNYTGDRLNFGLAAEQAKSEGYKMEMVIVGDDCALPPPRGIAGRRGLAGTILVHKVAGAAADAGSSLADVAAEAKHASEVVGTMGVALSVCTLPGQHGEPGVAVVDLQPVDVVVEHVLKQILSQETGYLPITRGSNAVLLINGLGATPIMELMIAARKAVPELQLEYGIAVDRVYTGTLMTSLDMAGLSITILKSDENILKRLDAPTKAPAWPVGSEGNRPPAKFPIPVPPSPSMKDDEIFSQPQELSKQGCILEAAIKASATEIINIKDSLNEWDSKVGDGDCGTTMYRGATAILEDMKNRYPMNDAAGTINEIGATIRRVMGGTSGILYDILCKAAYASLKQSTTVTANEWADALEASVAAVSKYGGASAGYRTMLDALIPASTVLKQRLKAGDDPVTAFIASSEAASAGAESTKQMQAKYPTAFLLPVTSPATRLRFRAHMAARGKKLINDPNDVVTQFIEGLVETYPGLQYLDGFPEIKVVLRSDVAVGTYDKVAVICGGGSGHEPAHGGFVGQGMLTAAVSGDVFTSPPVNSILAAIRAVTGPKGCLLVVTNYTGDRLNFGLAAEEAKSEGYKVEVSHVLCLLSINLDKKWRMYFYGYVQQHQMAIVGDDCALPQTQGIVGRRGLAGTILVNKVAGAAADAGLPLEEVAEQARHASELVGTVGVALSVCTLPGQETSNRLGSEQIELGLGIHGEPGAAVTELQPVDVVVTRVLKQIFSPETQYVPITRGDRVILLINGLGATPIMELMIATRKAVRELQLEYGIDTDRVYTGSFMTSLDMQGFSISIMKSHTTILQCLDASTKAPYWPAGADGDRQKTAKIAVPASPSCAMKSDKLILSYLCSFSVNWQMLQQSRELTKQGCILEASIEAGAKEIIRIKDSLNEWDSKVGDGDCGTTMYRGAVGILDDMKKCYPMNDAAETVNEIGATVRRVMGGTTGILYDILCKAAYASLKGIKTVEAKHWANALQASIGAISKYGGAHVGYRTMLDALIPASTILRERLEAGDDPLDAFVVSSEAAMTGAESTRHMQAQAGRSSYIAADKLASAPDPGAMAAAAWYRAAALSLKSMSCRSKP